MFNLFSGYLQPVFCVQQFFFFAVWQKPPSFSICSSFSVLHSQAFTLGGRQVLLGALQAFLLHVHDVFQPPNSFCHFVIFDIGSLKVCAKTFNTGFMKPLLLFQSRGVAILEFFLRRSLACEVDIPLNSK